MPLETASDQAKAQQTALLQAIAEQGTRGADLYKQQNDVNAAQRQAAVSTALDRASTQGGPGAPGAPASLQTELAASAAKPADEQAAYLTSGQGAFQQDQAALTGANDTYMNQLGAAIPLVAAHANAAAAAQAREMAMKQQLAQMELEKARIGLDREKLQGTQLSVAAQKDARQQAMQANQQEVITQAQHMGSSGNAFLALVQNNPDLPSALADLHAGSHTMDFGMGRPTMSPLQKDFGQDIDLAAIEQLLSQYYNPPGTSSASPAPAPSGSSGGLGAIIGAF
jgi:hypothetical protein